MKYNDFFLFIKLPLWQLNYVALHFVHILRVFKLCLQKLNKVAYQQKCGGHRLLHVANYLTISVQDREDDRTEVSGESMNMKQVNFICGPWYFNLDGQNFMCIQVYRNGVDLADALNLSIVLILLIPYNFKGFIYLKFRWELVVKLLMRG
jgi:hypothetical protein